MSKQMRLAVLAALIVCAAACGGASPDVEGRTWSLTELQGSPPLAGTIVDLEISDDSVSGSSGCNRYVGAATVSGGEMTLGPELAGTLMSCADDVMAQEQAFIETLLSVTSYEVSGDQLRLLDDAGTLVALFD